jgi:hypothetical protein
MLDIDLISRLSSLEFDSSRDNSSLSIAIILLSLIETFNDYGIIIIQNTIPINIIPPKAKKVPTKPVKSKTKPPMAGPIISPTPKAISTYPIYLSFSKLISFVANEYAHI